MSNKHKKLLVFVDTNDNIGHEADFRSALRKALDKIPYSIFEDLPKEPESIFSVTMERIINSDVILLDAAHYLGKIPSHFLIQYGICYALEKKCLFIFIKNDSLKIDQETRPTVVEGYLEYDYYLDLATQFKVRFLEWFDSHKPVCKEKPNKIPVHSFVVFGVDRWKNPDLYDVISNFSSGTDWTAKFVSDLGSLSKLESLANAVGQRSFCVFCLNSDDNEKIHLGVGLAIGMGRPFLIIKPKNIDLPKSLSGYHGILEYETYSQLKDQLSRYTSKFLSDEVFKWEGATYNDLLSRLEKRLGSMNPEALDEVEVILDTVISVLGSTTAKPFALLGEVYREKNHKISPDNIELLIRAKEYYVQALNIQKDYELYQNAITAIDRHIQLIELIKGKKYRSIPTLINLIAELKGDYYLQVKEYLLSVIKKLIEEKDFVHAISLLAAMQTHDNSEDIQKLVQQVLNSAPLEIIKALQDSQKHVVELENEKARFTSQLKEKDVQFEQITKELESLKSQLITRKGDLERIQKERNELSSKLINISAQLGMSYEKVDKLETDIETAKALGGRGVLVDFGYGWAVYEALSGEPRVFRNKQEVPVEKGFVFKNGDKLYDDSGQKDSYLGPEAIIIESDSELYSVIQNWLSQRN